VNWKIVWAAVALAAFSAAAPAQAQAPPAEQKNDVALALVLAVDASGSVDNRRFELQKQGYAAAFRSPQVLNSIRSLVTQSIAVTMVQWTGSRLHVVVVDWMAVKDEASVDALATAIEAAPRQLFGGGTSISGAIDYARLLLAQCPYNAARRVIDISGDGSNNSGRPVTQARDEAVHDGVGINGLPILSIEPFLDRYYYDNVIGGPGAFMIPAENYDTFADAILKKLITEVAMQGLIRSIAIDPNPPQASQTRPNSRASLTNSVKFVSGEPRCGRSMRGFHNNSFDPQTLVVLEAAFDEAWLTLKAIGNTTVKADELARSVLALAMEGERDPVRLHDGALKGLVPAASWGEGSWGFTPAPG
jgi:hypothetical protein